MTGLPDAKRLFKAMDATWAAAEYQISGSITLRRGLGGGKRVSAATVDGSLSTAGLKHSANVMSDWGQTPMFMVRGQQDKLDDFLNHNGYGVVDPVVIMAAPCATFSADTLPPLAAIPGQKPLAIMREIWQSGGIGAARLDVMRRTEGPKEYWMGRHRDKPAGCAFVACDKEVAMVHALEVAPDFRRFGVGRNILIKAANWAALNGAKYISAVTTSENQPAQNLFAGLGMTIIGKYHYRVK